jgi:hypothetical protein
MLTHDFDVIAMVTILTSPMRLLNTSLPAQSRNAASTNELADTGSSAFARQPVPSQKPTVCGPTHASSISDGKPPPEDATLGALKAIFKAGPNKCCRRMPSRYGPPEAGCAHVSHS